MSTEKKYIIFTDLKDFTYKNSLLTDKQLSEILNKFEEVVQKSAKRNNIRIIKSIGDAFLCVWEQAVNAYTFASEILLESQKYDEIQRIEIKKVALRVTITYGNITQNMSLNLEDYFGEAINLGARIMDMTPAGKIFCSLDVKNQLSAHIPVKYVGDFSFHGVLEEVAVYSLSKITSEEIALLQSTKFEKLQESEDIVFRSSCVAAILSIQPLPLLENFNLTAVHLYMILRISSTFWNELSLKESSKIFSDLIAPLGLSYAAFQWSASAIKILLPWIGGYFFAPVSFSVSYALGKIYIMFFFYKQSGEELTSEIIKDLFKKHKNEGRRLAKERKDDVFEIGKKYSSEILHIWKKKEFTQVQEDTIRMLKGK